MSWVFIVVLIVASLIKILAASAPSAVVERIGKRFQLHPSLSYDVSVKKGEEVLLDEEKQRLVDAFNESNFLEKYYYPPAPEGIPFEIEAINAYYYLYPYADRVDVFKYRKKKVYAYSLRSEFMQRQVHTD
ncbi:YfmQ family protein [Terribacillus sp. DMT04]|uniref:YfmQ family protein n=1 Tax=Terribacillus sp. DMT04 TaxID=2850441 RepID=UPI001C2C38E2|nr:YfmQ family protein [Terribacillus sp. DMT04]QXE01428.1 YfmQ family protein [Terribacillus sp. DMT04]